jgi:KaiC/GvpD/RAD55 family RecA-like ATPase
MAKKVKAKAKKNVVLKEFPGTGAELDFRIDHAQSRDEYVALMRYKEAFEEQKRGYDFGGWVPAGDCPNCIKDGKVKTFRKREHFEAGKVVRVESSCLRCGYWDVAEVMPLSTAPHKTVPIPTGSLRYISTGIDRLDDVMFGGIPPGAQVLLSGPAFIGKETIANLFLIKNLKARNPCIVIVTDITPDDLMDELSFIDPTVVDNAIMDGTLTIVDTYTRAMGLDDSKRGIVHYVDNPTDHKGINDALDKAWGLYRSATYYVPLGPGDPPSCTVMLVRSMSTLMTYTDPTATFKFLQNLTGQAKKYRSVGLYLLDKGMHTDTEVQTLAHLLDGAIEVRTDGVKTFLSVQGITDVQTRQWVQYQYTKKEIHLGSFTLSHI